VTAASSGIEAVTAGSQLDRAASQTTGPGRTNEAVVAAVESREPTADLAPVVRVARGGARQRLLAEIAVLLVMVAWATNFVVVKGAITVIPPVGYALIRFAIASATLLVLLRWREGSVGLPRRDVPALAALGVAGFGLYQVLWATALSLIPAGDAAILGAGTPVLTALLAVPAGSDTLTWTKLAGGLVSFVGVGIVVGAAGEVALGRSLVGDGLILASSVLWAVYSAYGAPILRRFSPLRTTTWAIVFGTLFLVPFGLWELRQLDPTRVGPPAVGAILYSAFLSAGVANVVVLHGIRLLGPTRITAFQFLIPAVTVVVAFFVLGEPIRPAQVLGGTVIVAGVLLTRRGGGTGPRWRHRYTPRR
jgi:drug/metabolite transporter (DMT)-like permease